MKREITFKGQLYHLVGRSIEIDTSAPNFRVYTQSLEEKRLSDYKDKIKIITTFLSLDTSVCQTQVKEFNIGATKLSKDIVVLCISKDLPFAQKRFCAAENIEDVHVLSDYKYTSFGINYGVLIKKMNLLSRAVFIIDKSDIVRYIQQVDENAHLPNYSDVYDHLEHVINSPVKHISSTFPGTCKPCEEGVPPLNKAEVSSLLKQMKGWDLINGKKITKDFKFKDFIEAKYFIDLIAVIAEEQNHHPRILFDYNKLNITLWTHAAEGLTDNDFILAKAIDQLVS
ncbi:MAG: hypothetical protein A2Y03_05800 [Omnitrophica WOR_2 bacterium GWF2_38_59]|nr:MAG: hypothetical protein A2Y03_05800 [Omnitrophica WOR_2 bacterium GWF2_38_59]OGX51030.1 MAG: hypothetical protein A2243_04960 [Omnitrophica WOR_2 bacterium RIFOXYA2_FULL_38_17]OGX54320.1 MAG: hypothetical protein A2267_03020 [Omnitrophica WOR_2 bacterium RIFOXYA12_FULL_38_10]OGX56454.1 MAG: hypothetical protein A2306_11565 [Omnitrophica WOR_2 bacterium RIFOXYB2_FULL_38_16]OGX59756.1 MAG: hypothetical protein A2447_03095 [Omnitrophica WOR_2 bacterium RIFOXYC2_FULL_38_12]HBG61592.1 hypothet